jgi:hypothetical protein
MNAECGRATRPRRTVTVALVLGLALPAAGCIQGHRALKASHERHNDAIQARVNEELLLNLVRLRYRDTPLFLRVGSVVTQFGFSGAAGASAGVNQNGPDSLGLNVGVSASEEPTFTFTPLQDNEFVERLLTPIDLDVLVLLQRSGWSLDRVLRSTVQGMSGLGNALSASGPTPDRAPDYEAFGRVSRALRTLQAERQLEIGYESRRAEISTAVPEENVSGTDLVAAARAGYRFAPADDGKLVLTGPARSIVLRVPDSARTRADFRELAELLGLEADAPQYELVAADANLPELLAPAGQRRTIIVSTRSLLGTLFYLAHTVEIPDEHYERGLVTRTVDAEGRAFDWDGVAGDLMLVQAQVDFPEDAAVRVRYRGHWFFIDDADLESKSTFALLIQLLNLQSGATSGGAPLLTLPVGG